MRSGLWCRAAASLVMIAVGGRISGCGWRGLNSLPLPGTQGRRPGLLRDPGADARRQQHPTELAGAGRRRDGRPCDENRASGLACVGDHAASTATSTCPPTRPQRSARPACWVPTTSSWRHRQTTRRKASCAMAHSFRCHAAAPTRPPSRPWRRCRWCSTAAEWARVQDITEAFSTAFRGREQDLRSLIGQLDKFTAYLNDQNGDIIAASESLNRLVGKFAAQQPVLDRALATIPDALAVLNDERDNLVEAADQLGKFSALTADSVNKTKENLVKELKEVGPVLESLANAGPSLTRSLSLLATFPFPNETIRKIATRRLRQPDGDHRPHAQPNRPRNLHRHPVGVPSDRAGAAVGPHHRPVPQPVYRRLPQYPGQSADRSLPLGPGAVDASRPTRSRSSWPSLR